MRCGTQGHVAEPAKPTRRADGAQVAQTRGMGHASPRGRPGSATWLRGVGSRRAHVLVGPGNKIGADTQ